MMVFACGYGGRVQAVVANTRRRSEGSAACDPRARLDSEVPHDVHRQVRGDVQVRTQDVHRRREMIAHKLHDANVDLEDVRGRGRFANHDIFRSHADRDLGAGGIGQIAPKPENGATTIRRAGVDQFAFDEVHPADEIGDERRRRLAVDIVRRANLLDRPLFITTIRSDIVSASSWSCVTMMVVMPSRCCRSRISPRSRARTRASSADSGSSSSSSPGRGEGARERHALLLAAGELRRVFVGLIGRPTRVRSSLTRLADLASGLAGRDQAVADIVLILRLGNSA